MVLGKIQLEEKILNYMMLLSKNGEDTGVVIYKE
jgi:hypothetical protein